MHIVILLHKILTLSCMSTIGTEESEPVDGNLQKDPEAQEAEVEVANTSVDQGKHRCM